MKTAICWCISNFLFFKNILVNKQPKTRLAPVRIWNEEAVVKIKAIRNVLNMSISMIPGGKSKYGLIFFLSSVPSVEQLLGFFTKYQIRQSKMQANSPTVNPHNWRKGWIKRWFLLPSPSDDNVLQYLKNIYLWLDFVFVCFDCLIYLDSKVFPASENRMVNTMRSNLKSILDDWFLAKWNL